MATTSKIKSSIIEHNGCVVYLPPSPPDSLICGASPDVFAASTVQLYPIGTLAWFAGMGKKFRYAKAGQALYGIKTLVANGNYVPDATGYADDGGFYGHCQADGVAVAYDAGVTEIKVTGTQNTAKNFYQGGHLLHFDAARAICFEDSYVIAGPDAASTTPWQNQKVTLAEAKKYAIVAADGIEIWCNPYSNIMRAVQAGYETFMGVPSIPVASGSWFWLQTSGPVFITPNGWTTLCPGYAAGSRIAMSKEGIITTQGTTVGGGPYGLGYQVIGTLLAKTLAGSADAWINMNLDLGH